MAALSWIALAAALLLVPVPAPAAVRARVLAGVDGPTGGSADGPTAAVVDRVRRMSSRAGYLLVPTVGGAFALVVAARWGGGLGVAAAGAVATGATVGRDLAARRRASARLRDELAAVRLLRAELEAGARPEAAAAAATAATTAAAVHAFRIAEAAGAPLADALAGVDRDLEARVELGHAVSGAVAGARASAALLAGLPLLGLLLGATLGAHPLGFLTGSAAGRLVCCVGVLLDAAGVLWTQRLTARAERAC
jgi:tight adherence protein B